MAAGLVYHNITTSAGVTFTVASWVPNTSIPDVGAIPVKVSYDTTGAEVWTAANSVSLLGYVDGIETKLDALHTDLATTLAGYVDGLEGILGTTSGAAVITDANGTIQQYLRGFIVQWIAGTLKIAGGAVAHDGEDSGNPLKTGGRARSSEIAAVASDDRADFITDLVGKQIVLPYANPENFVSGVITSAMTGTTSTSLVAAPGSGLRNYITTIIVSNAHATVGTDIIIQDGSGGTTLLTIPAAAVYGGAAITLPTPLRQPTANTALYCANVTTGASTKVSAVGYKGA